MEQLEVFREDHDQRAFSNHDVVEVEQEKGLSIEKNGGRGTGKMINDMKVLEEEQKLSMEGTSSGLLLAPGRLSEDRPYDVSSAASSSSTRPSTDSGRSSEHQLLRT